MTLWIHQGDSHHGVSMDYRFIRDSIDSPGDYGFIRDSMDSSGDSMGILLTLWIHQGTL